MKAQWAILIVCLLAGACAAPTPLDMPQNPKLYEQYVVYGAYQDVLAAIGAKVEACVRPLPRKEVFQQAETGMAVMRFLGCIEGDELRPMPQDAPDCKGLPGEEGGVGAYLVLRLQNLNEERTQIDVYAEDLSNLAWPRLKRSIQYGAEGKDGCPESPVADPAP